VYVAGPGPSGFAILSLALPIENLGADLKTYDLLGSYTPGPGVLLFEEGRR
jgi:hypothetical protein